MAKVAMMESGLRRKQTYEEIIDYIQNDQDKIKYPDRTARFIRNTFQLSQLDGMGQALLEQQERDEMAERVKDYQLKELADQNETSKRIEDAKNKTSPAIKDKSLLPTSSDENAEQHENEHISNRIEQQSNRSSKAESSLRAVQENLDDVQQQSPAKFFSPRSESPAKFFSPREYNPSQSSHQTMLTSPVPTITQSPPKAPVQHYNIGTPSPSPSPAATGSRGRSGPVKPPRKQRSDKGIPRGPRNS